MKTLLYIFHSFVQLARLGGPVSTLRAPYTLSVVKYHRCKTVN